jgi:hypothetical protein
LSAVENIPFFCSRIRNSELPDPDPERPKNTDTDSERPKNTDPDPERPKTKDPADLDPEHC